MKIRLDPKIPWYGPEYQKQGIGSGAIRDFLIPLVKSNGGNLITIARRLATIEAADQILDIDDGRVAEQGKHAELIRLGGKYAEFANLRKSAENWQI